MTLSRGKAKVSLPPDTNICADCSKPDPSWASLSRGVLLCDECLIGHRRLGRHVSYVRSLKQPGCPQPILTLLHQLVNNGANAIWEHQLLDPSTLQRSLVKRKPSPNDPQYPNKENFVKAKYQDLLFVIRPSAGSTIEDLSHQLYSSVRTNNVETSLRLLAMGADANYRHPERGNHSIHVAALAGQPLQVELLVIYGADPLALDSEARTPADCAKSEGFDDLSARLTELTFELTDRLICYLCGRRPDHKGKPMDSRYIHILVPEMAMGGFPSNGQNGTNDAVSLGRSRLAALSDKLIADLAQDCYDEVDRRETDAAWQAHVLQLPSSNRLLASQGTIPFLPPNTNLSATRNQSRQKLGLLSERDFRTLLVELLREIRKRVRVAEGGGANVLSGCDETDSCGGKSPDRQQLTKSPTPKPSQISPPPPPPPFQQPQQQQQQSGPTLADIFQRLDLITSRLDRIEKCLGMDGAPGESPAVPMSPSKKKKPLNQLHHQNQHSDLQSQIFSRTSEVTRIVADLCSAVSASKTNGRSEPNSSDPTLAIAASLWTAVCGLCDMFEHNNANNGTATGLADDEKSAHFMRGLADLRDSAAVVLSEARSFALTDDTDAPSDNLSRACFAVAQSTRYVLAASRQVFSTPTQQ